jgi:hypothetical protein
LASKGEFTATVASMDGGGSWVTVAVAVLGLGGIAYTQFRADRRSRVERINQKADRLFSDRKFAYSEAMSAFTATLDFWYVAHPEEVSPVQSLRERLRGPRAYAARARRGEDVRETLRRRLSEVVDADGKLGVIAPKAIAALSSNITFELHRVGVRHRPSSGVLYAPRIEVYRQLDAEIERLRDLMRADLEADT